MKEAKIRQIEPSEYRLLEDFFYHAIFVPPGVATPARDIIYDPKLFIYVDGFGGEGDCGVVADLGGRIGGGDDCGVAADLGGIAGGSASPQVIGAAWARIIPAYGYIDDETPELAISVLPDYRGQGVGTGLLTHLFGLLRERGCRQTSLSVHKLNAAARLYLRMGYEVFRENDEDYIMVKVL
ncbi:MAG: GNAT family N-acetyltransferase [Clostridiales bacterium]|nr:GNAT family N-acetyltransferase [Clostridiales bacterium]